VLAPGSIPGPRNKYFLLSFGDERPSWLGGFQGGRYFFFDEWFVPLKTFGFLPPFPIGQRTDKAESNVFVGLANIDPYQTRT